MDKWVHASKLSLKTDKSAFSLCSTKSVTDVHKVNYETKNQPSNQFYFFRNNNLLVTNHSV